MSIEDWFSNQCISESPKGFTRTTDNHAPPPHPPEQSGSSSLRVGGDGLGSAEQNSKSIGIVPEGLSAVISATHVLWFIAFKNFNGFC